MNVKDQMYRTPEEVYKKGLDAVVVGSGIYMTVILLKQYYNTNNYL